MQCVRPAAVGGGHLFDLRLVHLSDLIEKRFRLGLVSAKRIERHPPVRLLARFGYLFYRIVRAFPAKNIFAVRVREVINLFWLPGPQVLKKRFEPFGRTGQLLGERGGIARQIECLRRQQAGSLMVPVVFANKCSRQKRQDDFRTSQAKEAHKLFERSAVIPIRQRLQYVLRCRVLAAEKPHIGNAQRRESVPRFDLADGAERRRLLRSGFIRAAAAARAEDNRDTLMLVRSEDRRVGKECSSRWAWEP